MDDFETELLKDLARKASLVEPLEDRIRALVVEHDLWKDRAEHLLAEGTRLYRQQDCLKRLLRQWRDLHVLGRESPALVDRTNQALDED